MAAFMCSVSNCGDRCAFESSWAAVRHQSFALRIVLLFFGSGLRAVFVIQEHAVRSATRAM